VGDSRQKRSQQERYTTASHSSRMQIERHQLIITSGTRATEILVAAYPCCHPGPYEPSRQLLAILWGASFGRNVVIRMYRPVGILCHISKPVPSSLHTSRYSPTTNVGTRPEGIAVLL